MINFKSVYILLLTISLTAAVSPVQAGSFTVAGVRVQKAVTPMREIKRHHVVQQSLDFSCGAAGLSTLLSYYLNDPVSEQEIIERLLNIVSIEKVKQRRGFSLFDLKAFAEERGYEVTGYQMDIDFLKNLDAPVLVPIRFRNYSHFVIVRGMVADRIFLADPAAGNLSMKIDQFERIWASGIGLVVKDPNRNTNQSYALEITKEDLLVSDYRHLAKLMNDNIVRTAVFPSEY